MTHPAPAAVDRILVYSEGSTVPASRRRFLTHVGAWIAAPITQRRASTPARPGPLMIDRTTWLEHFDGHVVDGCAVGGGRRYFFLLRPVITDADEAPVRLVFVDADRPLGAKRFVRGAITFSPAGVVFDPAGLFLTIGLGGEVFSYDGQRGNNEPAMPMAIARSELRAVVRGLGRVGATVYAVGWPHRVWRRRGVGQWDVLSAGLPADQLRDDDIVNALREKRLRAVAGFGDADLYAAGDGGEIWHWDGARWRRQATPASVAFVAACAADDRLFLADETGAIWSGRGERWTRLTSAPPFPVVDLAWYRGQLWCGMENGALERLDGSRLVSAEAPSAVSPGIQHLDVAPDGSCLVAAGRWGATRHDASGWQVLVGGTEPQ